MTRKPTIKSTVTNSLGERADVETVVDFGSLGEVDEHIQKHASAQDFATAIRTLPMTPPELAKKLLKRRPFRRGQAKTVFDLALQALFQLETLPNYCVTPHVFVLNGVLHIGRYSAVFPWADGPASEGDRILCFEPINSASDLTCQFRIVRLTVRDESRTIVVTRHVCERIAERVGIRGSHVLFLARSILQNEIRFEEQENGVPLLTIFDLDSSPIGYCPVTEIKCGLQRGRGSFVEPDYAAILKDQHRWRLKSFLPSSYFVRNKNGLLRSKRALSLDISK